MIALLLACSTTETTEDELVTWVGYVYGGDTTNADERLDQGKLWFDMGDSEIKGEQPYEDYPGFWQFEVPPGVPGNVRIEGSISGVDARNTVWAADSPTKDGNWLGGSLFAATDRFIEDLFETLGEDGDAWLVSQDSVDVLVVGVPAEPSWHCGEVRLTVVEADYTPSCWVLNESGEFVAAAGAEPAVVFAAHVPAGDITLQFQSATELYPTQPGDVVLAYFLMDAP